ncbi:cytochrome [Oesophagostomum dentatum]|uniref:Cytochrome n=1 Tax=Oesophagostomum dentatum TaxID=61180 RepID=A0A0B1TEH0_OESDE|nr:cytochrome [Oesophagostomum dentatum]
MSIPEGDYEKGKKIFKQRCLQCHAIDNMAAKTGPTLNGVMGRKSGTVPGYSYSEANKKKGVVWSRETMFEYLADPKKFMPGTKMVFPGMKKSNERADLIKYMEVEGAKKPA